MFHMKHFELLKIDAPNVHCSVLRVRFVFKLKSLPIFVASIGAKKIKLLIFFILPV